VSRRLADWLPGPDEWRVDGELRGHSLAETCAWQALAEQLADERADRAARRSVVVSPDLGRRWRRGPRA